MTTEFRKYGRSPLAGKVKLKHRELGEIYADGGDISAAGVFLRLSVEQPMAVGDEVAAVLPTTIGVAPHAAIASEARLRVVRITSDGIGLAFL